MKRVAALSHSCHVSLWIGGYYTEKLLNRTGYRIMVLNTNLYYDQNKITENMDDPAGQFSWADQVLTEAAKNKEKVLSLLYLLDLHLHQCCCLIFL